MSRGRQDSCKGDKCPPPTNESMYMLQLKLDVHANAVILWAILIQMFWELMPVCTRRYLKLTVWYVSTVFCTCPYNSVTVSAFYNTSVTQFILFLHVAGYQIWYFEDGKCKLTLHGHEGAVTCLQFDESRIISGALDRLIKIWNLCTGEVRDKQYQYALSVLFILARIFLISTHCQSLCCILFY